MEQQRSGGNKFLSCLGIGCLSLIGIMALTSLTIAGGGHNIPVILGVIAVVIFFVVRQNRKKPSDLSTSVPVYGQIKDAPAPVAASSKLDPANADLIARKQKLLVQIAQLQSEVNEIDVALRVGYSSASRTAANTATSTTVAAPKPKVKARQKVALSLQQWLIMAASGLVVVAGSIFVSVNINHLNSYQFLMITTGIALVAAFMAIWSRKISVLLANFMATFSSAMQIASMLIVGDIGNSFAWNNAPAWWWSITLIVVAALAYGLAKFSANFGWKVIALCGSTAASLTFGFGVVRDHFATSSSEFGWFTSVMTVAALTLTFISRQLRAMEPRQPVNKADAAYEKDLAKRESAAMQRFTSYSAALLAVTGFGYFAYSIGQSVETPFNPLPTVVLTAVWLAAALTQGLWVPEFTQNKKSVELFDRAIRSIAYVMVAVSASSLLHLSSDLTVRSLGTGALAFAVVLVGHFVARVKRNAVAVRVAHYAVLVTWMVWNLSALGTIANQNQLLIGGVFILFGLSMLLRHWLEYDLPSALVAIVSHTFGMTQVVWWLHSDSKLAVSSFGYALSTLGLILLLAMYSPVLSFVAKRAKKSINEALHFLVFVAAALLAVFLIQPDASITKQQQYIWLDVVLLVVAFVPLAAALLAPQRFEGSRRVLLAYGFGFQLLAILTLGFTVANGVGYDAGYTSLFVAVLAALNFALGSFAGDRITGFASLILANGALLITVFDQNGTNSVTYRLGFALLVSALISAAGAWMLSKRLGVEAKTNSYVSLGSTVLVTIITLPYLFGRWHSVAGADVWLLVGELMVAGLICAGMAEIGKDALRAVSTQLRVTGLIYLGIAFTLVQSVYSDGSLDASQQQDMVVALFFGAVVIRQLRATAVTANRTSKYGWFALSYAAPVVLASIGSDYLIRHVVTGKLADFFDSGNTPELRSIPFALAIAIPLLFSKGVLTERARLLLIDLPLIAPLAWSAIYGIHFGENTTNTLTREVITFALFGALSLLRTKQRSEIAWAIAYYASLIIVALSSVALIYKASSLDWKGPELYAVAVATAVFFGNRQLGDFVKFKSTLITWGAPMAVLLLPPIVYSYSALGLKFEEMSAEQVTRVLAALVISAVALVLGIRFGNLGVTSVANLSLALIAIPTAWARTGDTDQSTMISLRGLLVGATVFWVLALIRRFDVVPNNSMVYIGLPSMIALAPSIYLAIDALGHPTLTAVDWWRFGIVIAASLLLLIIGALRELAGMFFPGLIGVLVAVLPYAFKPMASQSWFLWVLLLIIAGIMVWVAVRIDQMRKVGKSSVNWMKTLR